MSRVLIVDDEPGVRSALARTLRSEGFDTVEARDGVEAVSRLRRGGIDAVLLDLTMPRLGGLEVLDALAEEQGAPPALVLTAHASLDNAVEALRRGAVDFLEKPVTADVLLHRLGRALAEARRRAEQVDAESPTDPLDAIVGTSPAIEELKRTVRSVAATPARVLILGESGSGKELVARAIHGLSARRDGPLVRVNCAAVPDELFEAELFGHVKGAFTGATQHRRGRFERASGGTLFLDEIGEVPLGVQPKLLRALEDGEIERVGAEEGTAVDVRIVAATNRDLGREVAAGRFREDLYYRLEVVTLRVPPLRERAGDVGPLFGHFLARAAAEIGRPAPEVTREAAARLEREPWPGNVRQLRNLAERIVIIEPPGAVIDGRAVARRLAGGPAGPGPAGGAVPTSGRLADAVAAFERAFIAAALARHGGNVSAAARELGFDRSALHRKIKALGIPRNV
ncbi:MAG: sigma-54-dependent Fis family transcriptional regulator [Acidobacteria bacterium]|nr:MAG: sigma-54-dependent Fis family transcriptional regulator [Acidobacteriota bacterium]